MSIEKLRADLALASKDVNWGANPTITPAALPVFRALLDEHDEASESMLKALQVFPGDYEKWNAAEELIQRYGEGE